MFNFALLRTNFTFPLHYIFIPLFVLIKLKLITNRFNTSAMRSGGQRHKSLSKNEICGLWLCAPCYNGPYESAYGLTVYSPLLWWRHCGQFIMSVCLSQSEIFFPVIHLIAQLNVMLKYTYFFRNTTNIKTKILSFSPLLILRMLSSSF